MEKTEQPNPRQLNEALARGDIPLSSNAVGAVVLLAATLLFPTLFATAALRLLDLLRLACLGQTDTLTLLNGAGRDFLLILLPWLSGLAVVAAIAGLLQTRGALRTQAFTSPSSRFGACFRQGFRAQYWVMQLAGLVAACGTALLTASVLKRQLTSLGNSAYTPKSVLPLTQLFAEKVAWAALALALVIGAVDAVWTYIAWRKRQRLTRAELRRSQRDVSGQPEQKAEWRRRYRERLSALTDSATRAQTSAAASWPDERDS